MLAWVATRAASATAWLRPAAAFLPGPLSLLLNPWTLVVLGLTVSHGYAFTQGKGWADRAWATANARVAYKMRELNQRLDMAAAERDAAMEHAAREALVSLAASGEPACTLDKGTLAKLQKLTGGR